ncbi:sigma 54-interacting transcriptional regulator [Nitrospira lenta]|uniref:Hydrogenase-4 transcriptional activator n=1 Tax=Nitrospira lenta TaxID=1436998 RepID=A0A330L774_9BACT|nr:sigma 54-interacting transcriptional regulator [Nitrospira lenta]SPP65790.1 Hydrogenase-4 transcriptional activator [Nitrospira lenta]
MGTTIHTAFLLHAVTELLRSNGSQDFGIRLVTLLKQQIPLDAAGLYLYNQSVHTFTLLHTIPSPNDTCEVSHLPATGTAKEAALLAGHALRCDDLLAAGWTEGSVLRQISSTISGIVAPLMLTTPEAPPRPIAVMFIGALSNAAFTEEDRALLDDLSTTIAPVLKNVLAVEERDALRAINNRLVVGSFTIETLLPATLDLLQRSISHDMRGLVRFVHSSEGPWFDIVCIDGVAIDLAQLKQFPFNRMAPAEMLATGKPLLLTGQNRERFPERSYIESVGIMSCMLCPLIVRGTPYGFLAIGSKRTNAFSEENLAVAEQFGYHLSQAIANLTAYEEIRTLKEQLEQENVYLRDEMTASVDFNQLVGESPALQKTLKAIEQVAPTDSTVLITGETGTGKELVAQAIHRLSPRKDKPLITVNCAALPPTLIESELFGHEKGAFTNATARKIGRFELANGGTIFLDEIGELPIDLQAKFLRVLEAQELERVGGTHPIKLNVRVLAATNVDMGQAVKKGGFRSDLFYRLNVFPICIPPLRNRREDIPMLARHFVKKYCERHRKTITRIGSNTLKALGSYEWPGNVRELEHMVERAVIVNPGPILVIDELDPPMKNADGKDSPRTLADAERTHIIQTLGQTNWVLAGKQGAAVRLGMKRSTLQHRIKKLGIIRPPRHHK